MHATTPVNARLTACALLLGNLVTGVAILGPAGMLFDLASGLGVSLADVGLLITYGGVILCVASPLVAWAISGFDRRRMLVMVLAILVAGHAASALAPNYATLLAVRILMLIFGAVFTPLAASTISLIVPEKERPSAIAFVFLGWSLVVAVGLPLVAVIAAHLGWRATFGVFGVLAFVTLLLHLVTIPAGLYAPRLSLANWGTILRSRLMMVLLVITVLWTGGQFVLFPYLGPLIADLAHGGTGAISLAFATMGVMGFVGNLLATQIVKRYGVFPTSIVFLGSMLVGTLVWAIAGGAFTLMLAGVAFWGLGFAAFNSMQQARLVMAAPALASATVALNTSANYVGQAVGSALGTAMFSHQLLNAMGYAAAAFMLAAMMTLTITRSLR